MHEILVLFYSSHRATYNLATIIARGIESIPNIKARIRTVKSFNKNSDNYNIPIVTHEDLQECIGLALGSPVRFGQMASPLKYFFESTTSNWLHGTLNNKPACVFTSSSSLHGGQESCLLSMIVPLMHHGMVIVGIPYENSLLMQTKSGGTPYGASHVEFENSLSKLTNEENKLCFLQGKRLAEVALKLTSIN